MNNYIYNTCLYAKLQAIHHSSLVMPSTMNLSVLTQEFNQLTGRLEIFYAVKADFDKNIYFY